MIKKSLNEKMIYLNKKENGSSLLSNFLPPFMSRRGAGSIFLFNFSVYIFVNEVKKDG